MHNIFPVLPVAQKFVLPVTHFSMELEVNIVFFFEWLWILDGYMVPCSYIK